jgi:hypothetical protein
MGGLSIDELCRVGGLGLTVELPMPLFVAALFFTLSRVENIRVSRFAIDGFSETSFDCGEEGSRCAAAVPLAARFSVLGNTPIFWLVVGLELEDRETDEATGIGFSITIRGLIAAMVRLDKGNTTRKHREINIRAL